MANKLFYARESVIKMNLASAVTINTASTLINSFSASTSMEGVFKDFTIKEAKRGVDVVNLQGSDSDGFQNQEIEEKPSELIEVTGTLILPPDEKVETYLYDAGTTIATNWTRYRSGLTARKLAVCFEAVDSTNSKDVSFAGTNMYPTAKDVKVTGPDGHWECSLTLNCLARDFYGPEYHN